MINRHLTRQPTIHFNGIITSYLCLVRTDIYFRTKFVSFTKKICDVLGFQGASHLFSMNILACCFNPNHFFTNSKLRI